MIVRILGDSADLIIREARVLISQLGLTETHGSESADVAIAPLLRSKLSDAELHKPRYGTLIFHPSLLPRHRGPDAIKAAFRKGESYTGATWFWANGEYDAGDICEQEVLEILPEERPSEFYARAVIPSALKMLRFALEDLQRGHIRRRPQRTEAATYEARLSSLGLKPKLIK